ncbi:hypothetical protein AAC387_Pa04g2396 [Persea americana]
MKSVQDVEFRTREKNEISDLARFLRIRYIEEEYLRNLVHRQRTRSLEPITKPVVFSTQHRQDLRIPKQNEDFSRQGIDLPSDAREFSQKPMEISKSSPLPSFPKNSPTSRARIPRNLHKNA